MHIFSFENNVTDVMLTSDCLFIFLGSDAPDAKVIDDAYVRWSLKNVPPPTTFILGQLEAMNEFWLQSSIDGFCRSLGRLYGFRRENKIILAGFDNSGQIVSVPNRQDLTTLFHSAMSAFVNSQIKEADVVIPAPLGTYFDKLSGRYSSHFIRAEALLESTACIEMLALRLLRPFTEWFERVAANLEVARIYLDTMSVWPIAEKLRQFHSTGRPSSIEYRIESFRSYDGLKEWQPPAHPAFIIISASTSDGLAKAVQQKLGQGNADIWTLLSLAQGGNTLSKSEDIYRFVGKIPRTLDGKPALNGLRAEFESHISVLPPGTETISIVGERFLSQPAKPKRVRLVHTKLEQSAKRDLAGLAKRHLVKIGRGRFDGRTRWTLSFDLDGLIDAVSLPQESNGDTWLKKWIKNYSAPSPVAIIYPSADGTSAQEVKQATMRFAELTLSAIKELSPSAEVFVMSSDELARNPESKAPDLSTCSVIVISPVIGNGFSFKQISASLRLRQPKGPRLYLTLASLSESAAQLNQLNLDIGNVATLEARYDFKYKLAFPVGRLDAAFGWENELKVLRLLSDELNVANIECGWLTSRVETMEELTLHDDRSVFLPDANGAPLALSTGFFLWEGSAEIEGDDLAPAVLLTIAALLQSARASKSKTDDTSLRSGIFQHALICPESFTRFNDPVIQAAILRAAYPSELNYSVSAEMSHDIARLLLKWLRYYLNSAGAAVPEFLLAIAVGKLRLAREDMKEVLTYAQENCTGWVQHLAIVVNKAVSSHG